MTKFALHTAARANILGLKPYRCARDDYSSGILLDANENSHGPSLNPKDLERFKNAQLERYPDPHQVEVKSLLSGLVNVPSVEHFYLGVGSDECIDMTIRVFATPGKEKILITPPTYGMYSVSAQVNDVEVVKVPLNVLDGAFQLDVFKIIETIENDPLIKVVFLCSPGNPTGTLLNQDDIKLILESNYGGVVFVDEAYINFCDSKASVQTWVTNYPNLIVSQTLSKAYGLAGIRLGYTISSIEIAALFNNTKAPYNISTPTSTLARQALSAPGQEVMKEYKQSIQIQRSDLIKQLKQFKFFSEPLGANDANFVLIPVINKGKPDNNISFKIYKYLAEVDAIVVRFRGNEIGCEGCLRITVGTQKENAILIEKLKGDSIQAFFS
jgi:histidinol-phosphate aminotransferase